MLVSARVDNHLREQVAKRLRPEPEYLRLERDHEVHLLDWTALGADARRRVPQLAVRHALMALRELGKFDAVLSDGENIGVPLALAIKSRKATMRHAIIGHHLTTLKKRLVFGLARSALQDSYLIVHCRDQLHGAQKWFGVPANHLALVPYGIDLDFWHPLDLPERGFVMAAGREHRDYVTLAMACDGAVEEVFVAGSSLHIARAHVRTPRTWPAGFHTGFSDFLTLRERYATCRLFVLPLIETDFQAGITSLLEAMAMGKAVIATANRAVEEVVVHGETGVLVPAGDPGALRNAILELMLNPGERRRLGRNARDEVERNHSLDDYAARLDAVTKGAVAAPVC
jgi:glycosyltransferase involved in cell wall biosynthesis